MSLSGNGAAVIGSGFCSIPSFTRIPLSQLALAVWLENMEESLGTDSCELVLSQSEEFRLAHQLDTWQLPRSSAGVVAYAEYWL